MNGSSMASAAPIVMVHQHTSNPAHWKERIDADRTENERRLSIDIAAGGDDVAADRDATDLRNQ